MGDRARRIPAAARVVRIAQPDEMFQIWQGPRQGLDDLLEVRLQKLPNEYHAFCPRGFQDVRDFEVAIARADRHHKHAELRRGEEELQPYSAIGDKEADNVAAAEAHCI